MQDPLSSVPHQTFQAHRANRIALPLHPSLPQNPNLTAHPPPSTRNPSTADVAAATVFAAPQLRDLKKEATAFMPSSIKRKKAGGSVGTSRINAAPSLEPSSGESHAEHVAGPTRPDLLDALKDQFGLIPPAAPAENSRGPSAPKSEAKAKQRDDYDKFVEEMGDILGPSS